MDKTLVEKISYRMTDLTAVQGIGYNFLMLFKQYIPIGNFLQTSSYWQVAFWGLKNSHFSLLGIPIWEIGEISFPVIFSIIAGKFYIMTFGNIFLGKLLIKLGWYKAQQQYSAKSAHISPYNQELLKQYEEWRETMNGIAEKVGSEKRAENKMTKL